MVNATLRQSWRKEGIPAPADRCVESWRCPVCGAPPDFLEEVNDKTPEALRCGICAFPFSRSLMHRGKDARFEPLPAHGPAWMPRWAYIFQTTKRPEATEGIMETALHPSYIRVPEDFIAAFEKKKGGCHAKAKA